MLLPPKAKAPPQAGRRESAARRLIVLGELPPQLWTSLRLFVLRQRASVSAREWKSFWAGKRNRDEERHAKREEKKKSVYTSNWIWEMYWLFSLGQKGEMFSSNDRSCFHKRRLRLNYLSSWCGMHLVRFDGHLCTSCPTHLHTSVNSTDTWLYLTLSMPINPFTVNN